MREAAQELALLRGERHGGRMVAEGYWRVVCVWCSGIFDNFSFIAA
jgi:hypothetical protein